VANGSILGRPLNNPGALETAKAMEATGADEGEELQANKHWPSITNTTDTPFAQNVERKVSNPLAHLRAARTFLDRLRLATIPDHCGVTAVESRLMPATCRVPRRARRCARTDAGGAIGREAVDAATVASGASIKPALGREALDTGTVESGAGSSPARRSLASRSMPPTCRAPRRAVLRPVLAGVDQWGVLGPGILGSRITVPDPNPPRVYDAHGRCGG